MQIDANLIQISVTELSQIGREKRFFSIPGPSLKRAAMGRQAQTNYQTHHIEDRENYRIEVPVYQRDYYSGYEIHIGGRMDGLYENGAISRIDEVKSVILPKAKFALLANETFASYAKQLAIYQWLLSREQAQATVSARLVYCNLLDSEIRIIALDYSTAECGDIYRQQIALLIQSIETHRRQQAGKKQQVGHIRWPFPDIRPEQKKIINKIEEQLGKGENLLINAATGTGKTAAALYPAMRFALANNRRVLFLTAKNTQQILARDTLKMLLPAHHTIVAMRLRAQSAMCANEVFFCHEMTCPFARDYDKKITRHGILEKLTAKGVIEPDAIYEAAAAIEACPVETMMQLVPHCDVIIGDINYGFDPQAQIQAIFAQDYSQTIVIIDEFHNLYGRVQKAYSPQLRQHDIVFLETHLAGRRQAVFSELEEVVKSILTLFASLQQTAELEYAGQRRYRPDLDIKSWLQVGNDFDDAYVNYYLHKIRFQEIGPDDPIDHFYFAFSFFLKILLKPGSEFIRLYSADHGGTLEIHCLYPGPLLNVRMQGFHGVIGMSATCQPFSFYRSMSGLAEQNTSTLSVSSPFPPENLLLLLNHHPSTRRKDRIKTALDIAAFIQKCVTSQAGNQLIFFPSFDYLQLLWPFIQPPGYRRLRQQAGSSESEREEIITALETNTNILLFAVLGGVFAEGVDYPGSKAIAAYIVSPGLPAYDFDNELQRHYFDEKFGLGEEYTYLYPGMVRVIQAAGRIIRRSEDRGVITLIGQRFAEARFQELFPEHWFRAGNPHTGKSHKQRISDFWQKR
jgi:DNA excision repair protein ERCC-2